MAKLLSMALVGLGLVAMGCQVSAPPPAQAPHGAAQPSGPGGPEASGDHPGPGWSPNAGGAPEGHAEGAPEGHPGGYGGYHHGGDPHAGLDDPHAGLGGPHGHAYAGHGPYGAGSGDAGGAHAHEMLRELAMLGVHFYPPQLLLRRSKALGLTPDQLGKIRQEILSTQARAVDLHAKVERAKVEVARLLAAEKVDERALSAQLDEAAKAHAELHKLHVGELLHVRALLTPEQRQKLDERRHGGAGGHPGGPVGQADAPDDDDDDDDGDDEAEG